MIELVHGKGEELMNDIANLFRSSKDTKAFGDKWGDHASEFIIFNFVLPVYQAKDRTAAALAMKPKIDLFCASFYNNWEHGNDEI